MRIRAPQKARGAARVADGKGQRVGRVVRARHRLEPQQVARHVHHLTLFGQTVPHDGLLDLHGRVFIDRQLHLLNRAEDDAAAMRHGDAGRDILAEKQFLDRNLVGLHVPQELLHLRLDLQQARRQREARRGGDGTVALHAQVGSLRVHDAEADRRDAGVNPQNPHGRTSPFRFAVFSQYQLLYQSLYEKAI